MQFEIPSSQKKGITRREFVKRIVPLLFLPPLLECKNPRNEKQTGEHSSTQPSDTQRDEKKLPEPKESEYKEETVIREENASKFFYSLNPRLQAAIKNATNPGFYTPEAVIIRILTNKSIGNEELEKEIQTEYKQWSSRDRE